MAGRNCIAVSLFAIATTLAMLLPAAAVLGGGYLQSPDLLDKIKPGVTTAKEVEEILGAPSNRAHFPARGLTSMDYQMMVWSDLYDVAVMIGDDGVVREVLKLKRHRGGP